MQLTGSEIIVECLKEQGVDTVFGYPGGTILNVYDALYSHSEIKHILTSHEQVRHMRPTAMPDLRVRSVFVWLHRVRVRQTLLPVSLRHIWIPFRLLR